MFTLKEIEQVVDQIYSKAQQRAKGYGDEYKKIMLSHYKAFADMFIIEMYKIAIQKDMRELKEWK